MIKKGPMRKWLFFLNKRRIDLEKREEQAQNQRTEEQTDRSEE